MEHMKDTDQTISQRGLLSSFSSNSRWIIKFQFFEHFKERLITRLKTSVSLSFLVESFKSLSPLTIPSSHGRDVLLKVT